MKKVDLAKVFPIQEITDDCMVNGNGDVTVGFSIQLPQCYTMSDRKYRDYQIKLERLIKMLPVNAVFHQQDFVYENSFNGKILEGTSTAKKDLYNHFYLRPIIKHYTNFYVSYSIDSLKKVTSTNNSLVKMGNYVFGKPFKDVNKVLESAKTSIDAFHSGLKGIEGLGVLRLKKEGLKRALYEYFSQEYMLGAKLKHKGASIPDMEFADGYFKIGNKYVGIVSLKGEPKGLYSSVLNNIDLSSKEGFKLNKGIELPSSFTYPLTLGLPFNHVVNTSIGILNEEDATMIVKGSEVDKSMLSFMGMFSEKAKIKLAAIHGDQVSNTPGFFQVVANYGLKICRVASNVIVADEDKSRLVSKLSQVKEAYQYLQEAQGVDENMELMNTFFCSAPGNIKHNTKTNITTVDHAACYLPKETQAVSHKDGLVFVSRNGEPVLLNMDSAYGINNKNVVLFAPSGSGKSVLLNNIINQSVDSNIITVVIDVGGSYKSNCSINGGYYYDTAIKSNLRFNIFVCDQDKNGNYLYAKSDEDGSGADDQINYVFTVLRTITHGGENLKNVAKEIYKDIIVEYYKYVNKNKMFPDVIGFRNFIQVYLKTIGEEADKDLFNFHELERALKSYCEGDKKELLNSKDPIKLEDHDYLVFDLQGIAKDEDLLQVVMAIIIRTATRIIETRRGKKRLIIDEAIDSLKGEAGEFIGGQYRKIRKADGQVILATQGIKYLMNIDPLTRDSILGNSDIRMLLSHSSDRSSYPLLREKLSLVDFDIDLLESLDKGEYEVFFKFADSAFVLRNEITAHNLGVFTTTPDDLNKIKALHNKHKHLGVAIDQFVYDKFKKPKENEKQLV